MRDKSKESSKESKQGTHHRLHGEAQSFTPKQAIHTSPLCSGQSMEAKIYVHRVRLNIGGHPGITTPLNALTSWRAEQVSIRCLSTSVIGFLDVSNFVLAHSC